MTNPFPGTELYEQYRPRPADIDERFPMAHITLWMVQSPQGRSFAEYAREFEAARGVCPADVTAVRP